MTALTKPREYWEQQDMTKARNVAWSAISYFEEKYVQRLTGSKAHISPHFKLQMIANISR